MKLSAFGLCVRKLRLELGLNLKGMAEALDLSSPYLSSIELGERALTEKIALAAVDFFKKLGVDEKQIEELQDACSQSMDAVPVAALGRENRSLVAAFARRLSEGQGVPPDVLKFINGGRVNGGD